MNVPKPQWAAYPGTDRLGRALTNEEKAAFAKLLRAHDYVGARLVALNFAHKLTRSRQAAKELMGRVDVRLVQQAWDPNEVPLAKALCRYVWSVWTHSLEESAAAERLTDAYLQEVVPFQERTAPSAEQMNLEEARRRRREAEAKADLEALRAHFEKAKDEVNLDWVRFSLEEIDDLQEMARRSGRDVREFYLAAERRKRAVQRLLGAKRGVKYEEGDES